MLVKYEWNLIYYVELKIIHVWLYSNVYRIVEFFFIQVLGRVYGKHTGFQGIMKKIDSLGNEVSNLGPDMIYNIFPFLRFFPFAHSKKLNELLKTKQEMISIVEQLSVYPSFYHSFVFCFEHDVKIFSWLNF